MDKTKELGFDAIEFIEFEAPEGKTLAEFAAELRAYAEKIGLAISSYTVGANFLQDDVAAEVERVKGEVDIAAVLGAPVMRHDVFYSYPASYTGIRTFDAVLPIIAPAIREVSEYAATKGIITMSENHGYIAQDADRLLRLFAAVNCPNYRYLCDIGNFICADENCAISVGKLKDFVAHVHAKDFFIRSGMEPDPGKGWFRTRAGNFVRGTIFGQGNIPTLQCLRIIKKSGYDGFVSLEFEGMEDPLQSIEIGLANLKRYIAML
jgi:sugar phosphate isomerase/epimerase